MSVFFRTGKLKQQVRKLMITAGIFLVVFILVFFSLFGVARSTHHLFTDGSQLAELASNEMESYGCMEFLVSYWQDNVDHMELVYDEERMNGKERLLREKLPGLASLYYITNDEVYAWDAETQRLLAEVCYYRLSNYFSDLKKVYRPKFLYSVAQKEGEIVYLATGTLEDEKRISEGGVTYELGVVREYYPELYRVMDKIMTTNTDITEDDYRLSIRLDDGNHYVQTFAPVYSDGRIIAFTGVVIDWHEVLSDSLYSALFSIILFLIIFLALGIRLSKLIDSQIIYPIEKESEIMNAYREDKDAKRASQMLLEIEGENEIGELAESFSDTVLEIERYVREIQKVSAEKERMDSELSFAAILQSSLLNTVFPPFPDRKEFELFASMDPAEEVGGDFYDYFLIDDDRLGLVIADVSGRGVPAAMLMTVALTLIKSRLKGGDSPAEALKNVNMLLCESNTEEMFVTAWLAVLQISTGEVVAGNAGHNDPLLRRKGGRFEPLVLPRCGVLGNEENAEYHEHSFWLEGGDTLFAYTNGLKEAMDALQRMFGEERILSALNRDSEANPERLLNNVGLALKEFVGNVKQSDDITMLAIKTRDIEKDPWTYDERVEANGKNMGVQTILDEDSIGVKFQGRVSGADAERLTNAICSAARYKKNVVLDLSEVSYLSSAGIGSLIKGSKTCRLKGGRLKVVGVNDVTKNILEIAGLDELMEDDGGDS